MGFIKSLELHPDAQAFPGATYTAQGTIPQTQCIDSKIRGDSAYIIAGTHAVHDVGAFAGFNLTGKYIIITAPPTVAGTYEIASNNDDQLEQVGFFFVPANPVTYYIQDGVDLTTTLDVKTLAQFLSNAGYGYTIKGGQLYTSAPESVLKDACILLFSPLT